MCDVARAATTGGVPQKKKPRAVPIAVSSADSGEINIAIKIGTCAVRVAVNAGGSVMRRKPNAVGIMIPNAISSAVITIFFVLNHYM